MGWAHCFLLQIFISVALISILLDSIDGHKKGFVEVDGEAYPTWFPASDRALVSQLGRVKPNTIVAKDGSGQFKTITDGINSRPKDHQGKYIIYVKAGIYEEYITVDKTKINILMYGNGPTNTIITGRKNTREGLTMPQTATFSVIGNRFIAMSIAFENAAGPGGERAVALHVSGDRSAFFKCTIRGYQDTLYVNQGYQFYRNCEISGTIDFIFGHSTTLIQNSTILVRKPIIGQETVVVADGTQENTNLRTGIVLQHCSIMPHSELIPYLSVVKSYLARPWKEFSTAVFLNNYMDAFIQRDGFMIWSKNETNIEHPYFAEFGNTGPGADTTRRVKWAKGLITKNEAARFTAEPWIKASTWLKSTGIPYDTGFMA